jgi:nucleotide-binding universal stress UspA family protein
MKILLGLDISPFADETLSYVCRTTWPEGTSVVVLSVVGDDEPGTIPSPVLLASVAQNLQVLIDDHVRVHEEIVEGAVRRIEAAGLAAKGRIAHGDPCHALVEAARTHEADLIVVGAHHHSAARRWVTGSVAAYLAEHAPCPLLIVPHLRERKPGHSRT